MLDNCQWWMTVCTERNPRLLAYTLTSCQGWVCQVDLSDCLFNYTIDITNICKHRLERRVTYWSSLQVHKTKSNIFHPFGHLWTTWKKSQHNNLVYIEYFQLAAIYLFTVSVLLASSMNRTFRMGVSVCLWNCLILFNPVGSFRQQVVETFPKFTVDGR